MAHFMTEYLAHSLENGCKQLARAIETGAETLNEFTTMSLSIYKQYGYIALVLHDEKPIFIYPHKKLIRASHDGVKIEVKYKHDMLGLLNYYNHNLS